MDRARFEHLLAAYGADFERWPAEDRAAGALFASQHAGEAADLLADARALDGALDQAREGEIDTRLLARRILAAAPRSSGGGGLDRRALFALAACAAFGVVLGYGAGLLAPPTDEDGAYFAMAFEAPPSIEDEG